MGLFQVDVGVSDGNGGGTHVVKALVDTGSTYTYLPESLLRRAGVEIQDHMDFELADSSVVRLPVGEATLVVHGIARTNTVVFGAEGDALLGVVTLQNAGLTPDVVNHRLVQVRPRL